MSNYYKNLDINTVEDYILKLLSSDNKTKQKVKKGTTTRAIDEIVQKLFKYSFCIVPFKDIEKFININNDIHEYIVVDTSIKTNDDFRDLIGRLSNRMFLEHGIGFEVRVEKSFIKISLNESYHKRNY